MNELRWWWSSSSSDIGIYKLFHILRKLSHDPVATAIPSSVTPKHDTLLSCPAKTPVKLLKLEILRSNNRRPDFEKATEVIPQIILSCEYMASS
ncbi:hypothetical protein DERP_009834 [Dermatophagoides pteronyssinus]|uniref:Uncharacterized protein n=1 Tax=Dermatophagoides pteronyssinus TaxID=6956 RepID=A0ABQ8IRA7_DERPT|nr:hypothetical protein DERP_009834 [Dermatophagoides pteronyssinus]